MPTDRPRPMFHCRSRSWPMIAQNAASVADIVLRSGKDRLADGGPDDDQAVLPSAEVAAVHRAGRASWQIGSISLSTC